MRKLANFCIAFALAVFAAHYAVPGEYILTAAAACLAAGVLLRRAGVWMGIKPVIALLGACIGFMSCFIQNVTTIKSADALSGREDTVNAVVTDFPTYGDGYTSVYVRLTEKGYPSVTARVYDYDGFLPKVGPGDAVNLTVHFGNARRQYGEESDYYTSRRVFAVCSTVGRCAAYGSGLKPLFFPAYAALAVKNAVKGAFPADAAPFMKALLMGDKTDFYADGQLYTAMRTSGLIHVVAVSGLHVSFLIGFLQLIMGRSRRSSLLCLGLVWLFVIMTGAGPSTVRAGFMQSLLLLAPLFGRENDGITSLSFPLAIILALNPAEAGSASLQMSFAAMAGILIISPAIYGRMISSDRRKGAGRLKRYAAGVVSSSLGATVFTAPVLALRFGYVPLLGPVTNLMCLWAVTLCFCGGFASCGLWAVWKTAGRCSAWLFSWLVRYISGAVGLISKVPYAAVYTGSRLTGVWLLITYAVFIVTYAARSRSGRYRWYVPAGLSAAALCAALVITGAVYSSGAGYFTAINIGQGESVAVMAGQNTVLIDCGGRGASGNAGEKAAAYLLGCGRMKVDALILTHFHSDHANGAARLMQMMRVDNLIIPQNADDSDGCLPEILHEAAKSGVAVRYIGADSVYNDGDITVSLFAPLDAGTENERGLAMRVSAGGFDMLVTGDMNAAAEKELLSKHDLSGTELIMAGHHGSKYSTTDELLEETGAKTAIISVGYNNYGHPSNAALRRLYDADVRVYRTDLNGNITVRTG